MSTEQYNIVMGGLEFRRKIIHPAFHPVLIDQLPTEIVLQIGASESRVWTDMGNRFPHETEPILRLQSVYELANFMAALSIVGYLTFHHTTQSLGTNMLIFRLSPLIDMVNIQDPFKTRQNAS